MTIGMGAILSPWRLATGDWQCLKVDSYTKKENSKVINLSKQQYTSVFRWQSNS